LRRRLIGRHPGKPACGRPADGNARVVARQIGKFSGILDAGDDMPDTAAREAVEEIVAVQQSRRRNDHDPELHRRQHAFPQRRHIAEHQQQAVAAADAEAAQPVGDPVRPLGELGKGEPGFAAPLIDEPQTRAVVATRHRVEIIERPVEPVEHRPAKIAVGSLVIPAMGEQEIARLEKSRRRHAHSLPKVHPEIIAQASLARAAYRAKRDGCMLPCTEK
jgi:8-oxo-dGTP pyrophosphatase MutT (NUDIX family)